MADSNSLTSRRARKAAYMRDYAKRRYLSKRDERNAYCAQWARDLRSVGPWGGLKLLEVRQLAEAAFHLEAWQSRPTEDGDEWPTPDQFFEGVAQAFEAMQAYKELPEDWSAFELLEERQIQVLRERAQAREKAKAERQANARKSKVRTTVRRVDAALAGPVAVKRDPLFSLFGGEAS